MAISFIQEFDQLIFHNYYLVNLCQLIVNYYYFKIFEYHLNINLFGT